MEFTIRDARRQDADILVAYNSAMARETEGKVLRPDRIGPGVANVLEDSRRGRYWVAESGGHVIGQIMVTYEWSDWRNGDFWWIQSVYVHPDWRRKAIGIRLYVEGNNTHAQQTYAALGMIKPGYLVMESVFADRPESTEK